MSSEFVLYFLVLDCVRDVKCEVQLVCASSYNTFA